MISDGHQLRESWSNALTDALSTFSQHVSSSQSATWRRIPGPSREGSGNAASVKGKEKSSPFPTARNVFVHRKSTKSGDLYRVMVDVPAVDGWQDLEAWKTVFATPELRKEWDPSVESSSTLEMFDPFTRIVKTKFMLGWPANPRDAVMIARSFSDQSALIDIATSLPRSKDEPAYLRPAPPYLRSNVELFAFCVQPLSPQQQSTAEPRRRASSDGRIRITCFMQHDLRTVWNIGTTNVFQQLSSMMLGLLDAVRKRSARVPVLSGYGIGVSVDRTSFDCGRDSLALDYSIVPDEENDHHRTSLQGLQELQALKEQRRLLRSVEIILPTSEGWDVRISTRASSDAVARLPWSTTACRISDEGGPERVCFQVQHAPLIDDHTILKVKLVIEYSGALKGIRLNGLLHDISADAMGRDLKASSVSDKLIQDASSVAKFSVQTGSSLVSTESEASTTSSPTKPAILRSDTVTNRPPAIEKSILSRVRRSYIYFSSLLQEPDAKWKTNTESRGVSVTQLDSIDPTLIVFKAEATFVGVGLWDLYSAVVTPGARANWDKQFEDAVLLEDVNELSELWHLKTKPAWPVTGRDAVVLKTVYKSPTTIHVFAFSVDDTKMFDIPPVDPTVIRTQVDLQGWAIEALSPTTTQLTLLEQSDPKGWSGKSTIPLQMIGNVAGVGEFAIKFGGPPIVTRLGCSKAESFRYEHDRGAFRVEYKASNDRRQQAQEAGDNRPSHTRQSSIDSQGILPPQWSAMGEVNALSTSVECELRCDVDTWTSSLDIVVDPPPQSLSCLRRHKLSMGGGGLWLTVGHDMPLYSEERILAMVRRAPFTAGKEKGVVMVNGKRIAVDVEELPEAEVKLLSKQKRIKPLRVPLDQPPVLGAIRRRRAEWDEASTASMKGPSSPTISSSATKAPSPLANFFTAAFDSARSTTQSAIEVLSPPATSSADTSFKEGKAPLLYALDAQSFAQGYHKGLYRSDWTLVSEKGIPVYRRPSPEISPVIPVHRSEKVLEGVSAEEVAQVVHRFDHRKKWDDRFDSATLFEEYGANCCTSFLVSKAGFPFRDRGFYVASIIAKDIPSKNATSDSANGMQSPNPVSSAIYCVSASFNPDSASAFSTSKYNAATLPVGRVYLDAWILETLDPYTAENYAIPSTRCTRLTAFDYAGSIPIAVNAMINSALPKAILSVASYMKELSPYPELRLPPAGYNLSGDSVDVVDQGCLWEVRDPDKQRTMLSCITSVADTTFTADMVLSLRDRAQTLTSEPSLDMELSTPKPKKYGLPSRPSSPDTRSIIPEGVDVTASSPSRHRRISSSYSGGRSPSGSLALRSKSRDALRSSTSNFTIGREFRSVDFVVAEMIVDLRLYPDGYDVLVSSCLWDLDSNNDTAPITLSRLREKLGTSLASSEGDSNTTQPILPISSSVHLLPAPLYMSNDTTKEAEPPVRHLVRLSLPTSQYDIPTIVDPLTGETRSAPPKPSWLLRLEGSVDLDDSQTCAIVRIEVRPLSEGQTSKGKKVITINGATVNVLEKEAARTGSPANLPSSLLESIRSGDGIFHAPNAFAKPLGIADLLLDEAASGSIQTGKDTDTIADKNEGSIVGETEPSLLVTSDNERPQPPSRNSSFSSLLGGVSRRPSASHTSSGIWNWWSGGAKQDPLRIGPSSQPLHDDKDNLPGFFPSSKTPSSSSLQNQIASGLDTHGVQQTTTTLRERMRIPRFSASTFIAAVLIAFLIGSLLRSLLSPADFIYVVTDLRDVPGYTQSPGGQGRIEPGWREIKRLLEVKYLVGGWDFQVAVVRRH